MTEFPETYAPRVRVVCASSYAGWLQGETTTPHLDWVITGTPTLVAAVPARCPICDGATEALPPPASVEFPEPEGPT